MILSFCIFLTNIIFLCRWENLTFVEVRASTGLQLVLNIGTLSVVFRTLIALVNGILGAVGSIIDYVKAYRLKCYLVLML